MNYDSPSSQVIFDIHKSFGNDYDFSLVNIIWL